MAIKQVLQRAIDAKGSSLRDYVDADGNRGSFQKLHNVYDRAKQPCVTCKTPIQRIVWAITGPVFHYSDTWQLVINTGTTIVTFLMVFLIQNTQNRDMSALHLKLDELIRVNEDARNKLMNLEDFTEEELEKLKGTFAHLAVSNTDQPEKTVAAIEDLEQMEENIGEAKRKIGSA